MNNYSLLNVGVKMMILIHKKMRPQKPKLIIEENKLNITSNQTSLEIVLSN